MHRPSGTISGFCRAVLLVMLVASLLGSAALAQVTSGTIFGTVKDASGAVVPNAKVTAKADAIGASRTVTTNNVGDFAIPNLPPATYTIVAEAQGFKKLATQGVVLSAADKLNTGVLTLQVGATESEVTVTADAGQIQIQSNSGERSDLISSKQLNDVALNGRMVLDYMKLIPGVVSTFDGSVSTTYGIGAFNVNGTRANQHEFTIDGASNVDTGDNATAHVTVNTDAIAEVKVLTSNYQAEFGKAAGGQVIVTTKSGSSEFHGNGRFFHRHEGFNANNYFLNEAGQDIAKYRYNYAGYQIGGPVLFPGTEFNKQKDKVFFFWGQEYYQQLVPGGVSSSRMPTQDEINGKFSDAIYNPLTGTQFANNTINTASLTPGQQPLFSQMQAMLKLLPGPLSGYSDANGNNYITQLSYSNPRREDILRLDYQLGSKNRFFGRWINNTQDTSEPFDPTWSNWMCGGSVPFVGGCKNKQTGWNLSLNLTSTITPTLLNEFSMGLSASRSSLITTADLSGAGNGITFSLPNGPITGTIPDFTFHGNDSANYPGTYLGSLPWHQANTTININDNLSWVKQKHAFKFGIFYQRNRKDQIAWGNANGEFNFDACATSLNQDCSTGGSPYASALLGYFHTPWGANDSFKQDSARPVGYFRYNQLEFYAQDTWKLTRRLTLDYGMRFAWIPPQYDAKDQVGMFVPSLYKAATAVAIDPNTGNPLADPSANLDGIGYASNGTIPKGGWKDRGVMPEPRLGFAYDLFGDTKTVLRGGFGMMHDRSQGNLVFNTVFNNPALVVNHKYTQGNIICFDPALADPTVCASQQAGQYTLLGNIRGADQTGKVPTVYNYSLGLQRELFKGTTLDLAYVGNVQRHLVTATNLNAAPFGTTFTAAAQNPANFAGGVVPSVEPYLPAEYAAAGYSFTGQYAYPSSYLAPYHGYGDIEYFRFNGNGNYNSLQVSVQRRFSKGLTFGGTYTWSHSTTTANTDEDWLFVSGDQKLNYRDSNWDRRHVVALNYVYDLPNFTKHFGGPKWLSFVTDGFQLSGVTQFMSGAPQDVKWNFWWTSPSRWTGTTDGNNPGVFLAQDQSGNLVLPAIGSPSRGTPGAFRTGGMQNWDMSLFKNFRFTEQRYIQLRLEAFNAFNHTNFNNRNYGGSVTTPSCDASGCTAASISKDANWGQNASQYAGVGGPRVVQLGAKVYF